MKEIIEKIEQGEFLFQYRDIEDYRGKLTENEDTVIDVNGRYIKCMKIARLTGYMITTNIRHYFIGIDEEQQCCEDAGLVIEMQDDDPDYFIGAEFLDITSNMEQSDGCDDERVRESEFITISTSVGAIIMCVYNEQNGYYAHGAIISNREGILDLHFI